MAASCQAWLPPSASCCASAGRAAASPAAATSATGSAARRRRRPGGSRCRARRRSWRTAPPAARPMGWRRAASRLAPPTPITAEHDLLRRWRRAAWPWSACTNIDRRFCSGGWISRGNCSQTVRRRRATSGRWPAGGPSACSSPPGALRRRRGARRRWSAGCAGSWRRRRRLTAIRPRSRHGGDETGGQVGRAQGAAEIRRLARLHPVLMARAVGRQIVFQLSHKSHILCCLSIIITGSL